MSHLLRMSISFVADVTVGQSRKELVLRNVKMAKKDISERIEQKDQEPNRMT